MTVIATLTCQWCKRQLPRKRRVKYHFRVPRHIDYRVGTECRGSNYNGLEWFKVDDKRTA